MFFSKPHVSSPNLRSVVKVGRQRDVSANFLNVRNKLHLHRVHHYHKFNLLSCLGYSVSESGKHVFLWVSGKY